MRATRIAALLLAVAACGGTYVGEKKPGANIGETPTTEAPTTTADAPAGPLTCDAESGISFETDLSSCEEAAQRGRQMAFDYGQATGPDTPAADTAYSSICSTIQGASPKTTVTAENLEFAEMLSTSGVCPGDLTMLTYEPPRRAATTATTAAPTTQPPPPPAPAPTAAPTPPAPPPTAAPAVYYANCDAVRAAGAAPIHAGEPGYGSHLDRDGDGIGCES